MQLKAQIVILKSLKFSYWDNLEISFLLQQNKNNHFIYKKK